MHHNQEDEFCVLEPLKPLFYVCQSGCVTSEFSLSLFAFFIALQRISLVTHKNKTARRKPGRAGAVAEAASSLAPLSAFSPHHPTNPNYSTTKVPKTTNSSSRIIL
jgi:hypothetical protein